MPRAAIKLSPARESVPEWWADEFFKRQAAIRERIVRGLRKAGRAMVSSEIRTWVSGVPKRECDHAIATLLSQGVVRQFEEKNPAYHGSSSARVFTYIKLTEQA